MKQSLILIDRSPRVGWRLYIRRRRWHHGKTGAYCALLGVALMLHDIRDRRVWFGVQFHGED